MSITVTYPIKTIPLIPSGTLTSSWFAVNGQLTSVITNVVRKDLNINYINKHFSGKFLVYSSTRNTGLTINPGDTFTVVVSGQTLKLTVNTVTYPGGTATSIITTEAWTKDYGTGYINFDSRVNYYIKAQYSKYNPTTNSYDIYGKPFYFRTDKYGNVDIDSASVFRSMLTAIDNVPSFLINYADRDLSAVAKLQVYEGWDVLNLPTDDINTTSYWVFFIVNAAMQFKHKYGNNMLDFVPEYQGYSFGKFVVDFKRPTYWLDLPFDISFLYDTNLVWIPFFKRFYESRINEIPVSIDDDLTSPFFAFLNRLKLPRKYQAGINNIKVWLGSDGTAVTTKYIAINYVDLDYIDGGNPITIMTEELPVDLEHCLPPNPVYLKWLGLNGSWNYWCFGLNQIEGLTHKDVGQFAPYISNLETAEGDSFILTKSATPELILGTDLLSEDKLSGIKTLFTSPKVLMLTNPMTWEAEGEKWINVKLQAGKIQVRQTKASLTSVEVTILLPSVNIQSQ